MVEFLLVVIASLVAIAVFLAFVNAVKSRKQAGDSDADGGGKWWSMKYLWTIPMVVIGVAVLWGVLGASGSTSSGSAGTWLQAPSLARVVEWKNAYWSPILVTLIIAYSIASRSEEKVLNEVASTILAITAFMLFVGFPVWVWATGPSTTVPSNASNEWVFMMPPGGETAHIPAVSEKLIVIRGKDFRYHCKYADGHEESFGKGDPPMCKDGGDVLYAWASNLRKEESNAITYFYR